MNRLARFIKERRKDSALSQVEMARQIGISNITLCRIENNKKIGSRVLRKLSAYFNISTRDLRSFMEDEDNE
ncbi:MAG: helix-turn-helix transcriptional regulator [Bacteroidales bacterium]|jgi:DNA-binding XRE family transcriptional regulator|nr:helix-turn-helix transcriptional regulator [Bacteroidales bacterium]